MEEIEQPNEANIQRAMLEIPNILKSRKTINKTYNSYTLKHVLERYRKDTNKGINNYIKRLDFEIAMDRLGHKGKDMLCLGQYHRYYCISDKIY